MADIIKVEHLSYVYNPGLPTAVTALDDVSFTVEEGDFVGIIGATGSGKSTLITHMNGLNKPTSGKIYIDGRDLWADPEKIRDFRFLTGLVFQYPEYQLFEETCYKDIAFGPKNMGLDEAEVDRRNLFLPHLVDQVCDGLCAWLSVGGTAGKRSPVPESVSVRKIAERKLVRHDNEV